MATIEKGVLILRQTRGSREAVSTTLRFRYDPALQRMAIIGRDTEIRDRVTGATETESHNLLTGVRIVEHRRYDEKKEEDVLVSSETFKEPTRKEFLEDMDVEI